MVLGMEVGLSPGDSVSDGTHPSAHLYCGQTAGCIKMPTGMEVGLSPGDFVFDGDPDPSAKGGGAPNFRLMSIAACIKMPLGT